MKLRRKKSIKGMTANVERSCTSGTCDDWRKRGEHKRSMSRGVCSGGAREANERGES